MDGQARTAPPGPGERPGGGSGAPPLRPDEERTWGMLAHLSALAGLLVPMGTILGPLVVWRIMRERSGFVDDQGKEALNFQITLLIGTSVLVVAGVILLLVLVGILFLGAAAVLVLLGLVFSIVGAVEANKGTAYRYPFNLRLVK